MGHENKFCFIPIFSHFYCLITNWLSFLSEHISQPLDDMEDVSITVTPRAQETKKHKIALISVTWDT